MLEIAVTQGRSQSSLNLRSVAWGTPNRDQHQSQWQSIVQTALHVRPNWLSLSGARDDLTVPNLPMHAKQLDSNAMSYEAERWLGWPPSLLLSYKAE